jgi:hypothetical protein
MEAFLIHAVHKSLNGFWYTGTRSFSRMRTWGGDVMFKVTTR